jgi:hypothetical protein
LEFEKNVNKITINNNTHAEIVESERVGKVYRSMKISQGQGENISQVIIGEDELRFLVRKLAKPKKTNKK